MYRALVFDFDGTILDTETPEYRSWERVYEQHGHVLPREAWLATIGLAPGEATWNPHSHLEALHGAPLDYATIRAHRHTAFLEDLHQETVRPGVMDWLDTAAQLGLHIGLASSSPRSWLEQHLGRLGIRERFAAIYSSDDVKRGKPDPELYLRTAAHFGVPPQECIAIEDSPNGVRAAKAAGYYCIATPNPITAQLDLSHADLRVEALTQVSLASFLRA